MKKIAIASDHGGFSLKETLKAFLAKKGYTIKDFGTYSEERCDYPEYAYRASYAVSRGQYRQGILICKSGIGNSIVANKLPGVRAALCYTTKGAELSRLHNDSNILVLGASFVKPALARMIVDVWLKTKFEGGRHARRLAQIKAIERKIRGKGR